MKISKTDVGKKVFSKRVNNYGYIKSVNDGVIPYLRVEVCFVDGTCETKFFTDDGYTSWDNFVTRDLFFLYEVVK